MRLRTNRSVIKFLAAVDFWNSAKEAVKDAQRSQNREYISNSMKAMYSWRKQAEYHKQAVDKLLRKPS